LFVRAALFWCRRAPFAGVAGAGRRAMRKHCSRRIHMMPFGSSAMQVDNMQTFGKGFYAIVRGVPHAGITIAR
jgi:hypothetical protein